MDAVRAPTFDDYRHHLDGDDDEFADAVRHRADQRHQLLPRRRDLAGRERPDRAGVDRGACARRAVAGVGGGLCQRRGGVHHRHPPVRGPGRGRVPAARQDLRHRCRRRGAVPCPPRSLPTPELGRRRSAGTARPVLRRGGRRAGVPQGPAAPGDLRAPRPRAGPAHLTHRPAVVPQHADVLHPPDPGADPAPVPLRRACVWFPGAWSVGGAGHPHRPVHALRPHAAGVPPCAVAQGATRARGQGLRRRTAEPTVVPRTRPARRAGVGVRHGAHGPGGARRRRARSWP